MKDKFLASTAAPSDANIRAGHGEFLKNFNKTWEEQEADLKVKEAISRLSLDDLKLLHSELEGVVTKIRNANLELDNGKGKRRKKRRTAR